MKIDVTTALGLDAVLSELRRMFEFGGYLRVTATNNRPRSVSQNAIVHAWYQQIADELKEDPAVRVKAQCKLFYGVPILRAEDDEFRQKYDGLIRDRFTVDEKLALMEWFPVTSLMNRSQLSQYIETMQREYAKRGVRLTICGGEQ